MYPGKVWRAWIGDLAFHELKLGAGNYLRYDRPWVRHHVYHDAPPDPPEVGPTEWHPEDTLYLTLVGQDQKRIIGIIGMREPADGRVPTASSLQPFELFASRPPPPSRRRASTWKRSTPPSRKPASTR